VTKPAANTVTVSGTVGNVPDDSTLTLTLSGSGGTFTAIADPAGKYSMGAVPAGDYEASYEWVDSSGTATGIAKVGAVTVNGDSNFSFDLE
jgi:hypothetical protein